MDLKALVFLFCLAAVWLTSTEAGIPKCCLQTSNQIPRKMLTKVYRWEVQHGNGVCDIPALVLYVSGRKKPVCAHPRIKRWLLKKKQKFGTNSTL